MGSGGSNYLVALVLWTAGCLQLLATTGLVAASDDPNSVFCHSNPCQNNGTCVNLLRPGSDTSLSLCHDGSCYKFITEKMDWEAATIQCSRIGTSLVSIETSAEGSFLQNAIKDNYLHKTHGNPENPGGFWTSGNDLRAEDQWFWGATDEPVTLDRQQMPGIGGGNHHCLLLYTDLTTVSRPQWKTAHCNIKLHFICEMPLEVLYQERTSYCLCNEAYTGEFCEQKTDALIGYACDNDAVKLCCNDAQRLSISQASFHLTMPDTSRCPVPDGAPPAGNCILPGSLSTLLLAVLQGQCNGRNNCNVNVTEHVLSMYNQCQSSSKYAKIEYTCTDTYVVHTEVCETSVAELSCGQSLAELPYIRVEMAVYGWIRPSVVCSGSTQEPSGELPTACRAIASLDVAASRCNGLSECDISASHDFFDDPCVGVYKYLDIRYQCVANSSIATASYPLTYGIATLSPPVFCPSTERSGVEWASTKEGLTDWQQCPDGQEGLATWHCDSQPPVDWSAAGPDMSQCISQWVNDLYEKVRQASTPANNIAELVLQRTAADETLHGSDLQKTVELMDDLLDLQAMQLYGLDSDEKETKVQTFGKTLLEFGSNVLDTSKQSTWAEVTKADSPSAAADTTVSPTFVTDNLESTGFLIAQNLNQNTTSVTISSPNILMNVEALSPGETGKEVLFQDSREAEDGDGSVRHVIVLPPSATGNKDRSPSSSDATRVVFLVYETLGEYLTDVAIENDPEPTSPTNGSDYDSVNGTQATPPPPPQLNSAVVSASAKNSGQDVKKFEGEEEVLLTIKHTSTNITGNVSCVFWNSSKSLGRNGAWSDKGCRLVYSNESYTICACNHLTNFAILMDVSGSHKKIPKIHEQILTGLTFIGCSLSIVCLGISLFAFSFFKNVWSLRVTIHRNLCFMLLVSNALFIVGVDKTQIKLLCSVIAALLHYCFLAAFVWMSLEAVQFYIMLVHVFSTHSRHWPYYLAGYGLPVIVVGVSAAVNHSGYGTEKYCWLSTENYFIWSFVGPVGVIIVVNVVLLVVSLRIAYNSRSSVGPSKSQTNIKPWIKGAMTLLFLLGVTWGVGFFFLSVESLVVAYIFTILNSLQGLFIFVFYCLGNERVNSELRKFVSRQSWLPAGIRERFGKCPTSASTVSTRTVSTHQISRPEVYQRKGSFDCSPMSNLNGSESAKSRSETENHFVNPIIDVTLTEGEGAGEGDEEEARKPEVGPGTKAGSSWLHSNSLNSIVADNKNGHAPIDSYPKVDYE